MSSNIVSGAPICDSCRAAYYGLSQLQCSTSLDAIGNPDGGTCESSRQCAKKSSSREKEEKGEEGSEEGTYHSPDAASPSVEAMTPIQERDRSSLSPGEIDLYCRSPSLSPYLLSHRCEEGQDASSPDWKKQPEDEKEVV